jgi:hypothetical protein
MPVMVFTVPAPLVPEELQLAEPVEVAVHVRKISFSSGRLMYMAIGYPCG